MSKSSMLSFTLSMPNVGSWNGKWSGEKYLYAIVKNMGTSKKAEELTKDLVGGYYYSFGDGWCARVSVEKITSSEARVIRRKSSGFCGYEWMVKSIIRNKKIIVEIRK